METKKIGDKVYLTRDNSGLKIEIDQKVSLLKKLLILLWLILILIAGFMLITEYLQLPNEWNFDRIFYAIMLAAWTFFLLKVGKLLAWRYLGKEIIEIDQEKFSIKNKYGALGKPQVFDKKSIRKFKSTARANDLLKTYINYDFLTTGGERFEFAYNNNEYIFGKMLTDSEVNILDKIIKKEIQKRKT